jgi:hypothetical protein
MKTISILWIFICGLTIIACRSDSSSANDSSAQQNNSSGQQGTAPNANAGISEGHDYTFLTDKLFHYQAVVGGTAEGQEPLFKDEWIDLIPDGTFKAGKLKAQTHTGKWGYNHDKKILFLSPNDNKFKRSEWKVMHNNDMVIWIGTNTYGDNAIQIKLVKKDELP